MQQYREIFQHKINIYNDKLSKSNEKRRKSKHKKHWSIHKQTNKFSYSNQIELSDFIENLLKKNPYLKTIDFSFTNISDIGACFISNSNVVELNVNKCDIKDNGALCLFQCKTLNKLDIRNNNLTDKVLPLLFKSKVTWLKIDGNKLSKDGTENIKKSLHFYSVDIDDTDTRKILRGYILKKIIRKILQ